MAAKELPGRRSTCRVCKATIVFARTMATESGAGGKAMPLDVIPNPEGNVAVREGPGHRLIARVLLKDETHDRNAEVLAMPHFATCSKAAAEDLVSGIEQMLRDKAGEST